MIIFTGSSKSIISSGYCHQALQDDEFGKKWGVGVVGGIRDSRDWQMHREKDRLRASVYFAPGQKNVCHCKLLTMKLGPNYSKWSNEAYAWITSLFVPNLRADFTVHLTHPHVLL